LADTVIRANYDWSVLDKKNKASDKVKTDKNAMVLKLQKLVALAKITSDGANKKIKYYTDAAAAAKAAQGVAQGLKDANTAGAGAAAKAVASAKAAQKAALSACKVAGYKTAQDARKAKTDADTKMAEAKKAYATKITAPTDGTAGTRCELPAPVGGVQAARAACTGTTCCGQAWTINRDGSVSKIESCQDAKAMTYTYQAPWVN